MKPVSVADVYEIVERIERKLDKRVDGIEERLYNAEGFINRARGVLIVLGIFTASIGAWVWQKVTQH